MNINLSKFKKISENKDKAVLQHPAGHKIEIAKKILSPELHQQLSKLPMHLAGGTPDKPVQEPNASYQPGSEPKQPEQNSSEQNASYQPGTESKQPTINIYNGGAQPQQPAPQPAPAPQAPNYVENGNFDWNKYIASQPPAMPNAPTNALGHTANPPIESKLNAAQNLQAEAQQQNQFKQADAQKQYQQIMDYNKLAAQQGLAPMALPNAPAQNAAQVLPADQATNQKLSTLQAALSGGQPSDQGEAAPQTAMSDPYQMYQQGIGEQEKANQAGYEAEKALAGKQAGIYGNAAQQKQNNLQAFQDTTNKIMNERSALMNDYRNGTIEPGHTASPGFFGALKNIIGLTVSGFGAGLGHTDNLAFKAIQANMARDMEKGSKLLDYNKQTFLDNQSAANMTALHLNDIASSEIQKAVAQTGDVIAKQRLLALDSQLHRDSAEKVAGLQLRQLALNGLKQSQASGGNDTTGASIQYMRMMNPDMAKDMEARFVPGIGMATVPVPDQARQKLVANQELQNAMQRLDQFTEKNGTLLDKMNPETRAEATTLNQLVWDKYRTAAAQGVFREAEKDFVASTVGKDPNSLFYEYTGKPKLKALIAQAKSDYDTLKQSYGFPVAYKPNSARQHVVK